jgi:hypothetical protein
VVFPFVFTGTYGDRDRSENELSDGSPEGRKIRPAQAPEITFRRKHPRQLALVMAGLDERRL